jgi:hypothetical protein
MVQDCLLLRPAGSIDSISKLADTALAAGSNHQHWAEVQLAKGLLEYRLGHYKEALNWARAVRDTSDASRFTTAKRHLLMALARHQLDRLDDARASLGDGIEYIKQKLPKLTDDGLGDQWNDWIIVDVLRREAETLIQGAK